MRSRILGVTALLLMLSFVLLVSVLGRDEGEERVHQHLTSRQPDAGCDCDGSELCSHLPLVIIDTGGQTIPGAATGEYDSFHSATYTLAPDGREVIDATLSIIDNEGRNNHPSDTPALTTTTEIRLRGYSSRHFEKAPYQLDFVDEEGNAAPAEVMGMSAHHEWALNGPYLDKSLVRNYMWYNLAGEIMEWAPNVRYCELIVDGDYRGLYLMVETITDGDDCRLDLSETEQNVEATGYLLRSDRSTELDMGGERDVYTYLERMLTHTLEFIVKFPKRSELDEELLHRIELDFAEFEKALYSYDYDYEEYGYWNYIDVDSFVDYYIINELSYNVDAGRYSTYLYKDMSGKYKLAVWDFNNSCDNYIDDSFGPEGLDLHSRLLYFMLFKDEDFAARVLRRYEQLREGPLSEEALMAYIDETLAYLGPAVERNNERWAEAMTQWSPLIPEERNLYSHEEAVEQLKDWLRERGAWLDENIHALQQYCHESRNKVYNH